MALIIITIVIIISIWAIIFKQKILNFSLSTFLVAKKKALKPNLSTCLVAKKKELQLDPNLPHYKMMSFLDINFNKLDSKILKILVNRNIEKEVEYFIRCRFPNYSTHFSKDEQEELAQCSEMLLIKLFDKYNDLFKKLYIFQQAILDKKNPILIQAMFEKVNMINSPIEKNIVDCDYDVFRHYMNINNYKCLKLSYTITSLSDNFCQKLLLSRDVDKIRAYINQFSLCCQGGLFVRLVNKKILTDDDLMLYLKKYQINNEGAAEVYARGKDTEISLISPDVTKCNYFWNHLLTIEDVTLVFLITNKIISIPKQYYSQIIKRGINEEIMLIINTGNKFSDNEEILLINRDNDLEISAYQAKGHTLCFQAKYTLKLRLSNKK